MNRNNTGANTNVLQMIWDVLIFVLSFAVTAALTGISLRTRTTLHYAAIAIPFGVIYIISNKEARIYNVTLFFYIDRFLKIITKSWFQATLGTILIVFFVDDEPLTRKFYLRFLLIFYVLSLTSMMVSRMIQYVFQSHSAPKTVFVGLFQDYQKFNYFLNKTSIKMQEVGYILEDGTSSEGLFKVLGHLSELEDIIKNNEIDQIYFMQKEEMPGSCLQEYIHICLEMGVTVKVIVDSGEKFSGTNSYVSTVGTYPVIVYHTIALNNSAKLIKRIMDVLLSLFGIIITSPIMLVTAVAIKLTSPGPIIFKQDRVGQNGRVFSFHKFRSMYADAEERKKELMPKNEISGGMMFKIKDDPRVTPVGKFIRKTSIDELPQLFDVLKGSMSLVGTRPPTLDEVKNYNRNHWRRISIKPGITGMWQVNGRSNITDFEKVMELDLSYIDNWTIGLDLKILFQTVGVLLNKDGAY